MGVSPFGYLRIEAYLQLPAAFRSLSRPSSAPDAKAFTLCSCSLELFAIGLSTFCFVLNCLSFFVHISVAVKKLFAFSPFLTCFVLCFADRSAFHSSKLYLLPYFVERPIFLNIMSSISVRFYSFTFIRFSMNMVFAILAVGLFTAYAFIPSGDTHSIFDSAKRAWPPGLRAWWR